MAKCITAPAATFVTSSDVWTRYVAPTLPVSFLREFLWDGRTPARGVSDAIIRSLLPALYGPGLILELGAATDYYKRFAPSCQRYITSNISPGCDIQLDMTTLNLPNHSADSLVSVFALEHIYDFAAAINEQKRVLKPGGRLLLVVPFLYYYHAAPEDYFRFSGPALDRLLSPLRILVRQPIGDRWLLLAEMLHEKAIMGSRKGRFSRFALRCLALPFLFAGLKAHDPQYAFGFAYLCEKV